MNPDNKPHDWQGDIAQERDNRMDDGHMEGRGRHQSSEQYENEQCGPGVEQGQYIAAEDNNCHRGSRNFGNNVEPVYPSVKRGVPRSVIEAVAKQLEEETVSLFEDGIETESKSF